MQSNLKWKLQLIIFGYSKEHILLLQLRRPEARRRVNLFSLFLLNQILSPLQIWAVLFSQRSVAERSLMNYLYLRCCANASAFNLGDKFGFNALIVWLLKVKNYPWTQLCDGWHQPKSIICTQFNSVEEVNTRRVNYELKTRHILRQTTTTQSKLSVIIEESIKSHI